MVYLSAIEGNSQRLDGGAMFGNVPKVLWEKWHKPDAVGRILLATRGLLIEDGDLQVLCETGIGNFFPPHLAARYGVENPSENLLMSSLRARSVDPDAIDFVILSHLHFDHVGGLIAEDGSLHFANAQYLVGERAFARACQAHIRDRASFIADIPSKLKKSGRLLLINEKSSIPAPLADKLEFVFTEGHTVGQMHVLWSGSRQKVFFAGDVIPGCAWVHLAITAGYDRYPERLIDEKKALYERAQRENWLFFYMHDSKYKASQITLEDNKYRASGRLVKLNRYCLS